MNSLACGQLTCDEFNDSFYSHGHRYLYTRSELAMALVNAGFSKVMSSIYKDRNSVLGLLDSHSDRFRHPPELSQYQEAIK